MGKLLQHLHDFRHWLIIKLARSDVVVINATIDDGTIVVPPGQRGVIDKCVVMRPFDDLASFKIADNFSITDCVLE